MQTITRLSVTVLTLSLTVTLSLALTVMGALAMARAARAGGGFHDPSKPAPGAAGTAVGSATGAGGFAVVGARVFDGARLLGPTTCSSRASGSPRSGPRRGPRGLGVIEGRGGRSSPA